MQIPLETSTRRRWIGFLSHLIIIGMLFVLPEILNVTGKPFRTVPELRYGVYVKMLIIIAIFYFNYFFLVSYTMRRGGFAWRIVVYNLVLTAGALALFWLISRWMQPYWDEAWRLRHAAKGLAVNAVAKTAKHEGFIHWLKFFSRDFVMLVLTIGLSAALRLSDSWMKLSRRQQNMLLARRQEELQNLKSQLNPHFLFNTLNSIYALIEVSPAQAQNAVHELSGMLRYVLYDSRDEVELSRELKFVENYVGLMKLRLPDSTRLDCAVDADGMGSRGVPPLLFIPLVENAFKYCRPTAGRSFIEISIRAVDDRLNAEISNSCGTEAVAPAAKPAEKAVEKAVDKAADKGGLKGSHEVGGIGLLNLKRRLQLIYGDKASLTTCCADGVFTARLAIPLPSPARAAARGQ